MNTGMDVAIAADTLLGTCQSLEEVVGDTDLLAPSFLMELDNLVSQCITCGWWVESDEVDVDGECDECRECLE